MVGRTPLRQLIDLQTQFGDPMLLGDPRFMAQRMARRRPARLIAGSNEKQAADERQDKRQEGKRDEPGRAEPERASRARPGKFRGRTRDRMGRRNRIFGPCAFSVCLKQRERQTYLQMIMVNVPQMAALKSGAAAPA